MNMKNNLELYVHTPFCVKKCDYCDFLSFTADSKTQIQYVHALLKEIRFYGELMQSYEVSTIYIGGGTPSWLEPELLIAVMEQIYKSFHVREDAEITLECNPGTVTIAKFGAYKKVGINRLSIGMQSANDDELKSLGRIHTFEQFLKTYKLARNLGFHNINVDIMSGLPHQTVEKFTQTLQKVIRLKPEHISAYSLIIEKGSRNLPLLALLLFIIPPICFIILRDCSNCLTSLFTSLMSTPAPAAIRFFREGFRRSGFALSFGVMERIIASI